MGDNTAKLIISCSAGVLASSTLAYIMLSNKVTFDKPVEEKKEIEKTTNYAEIGIIASIGIFITGMMFRA